MLGSSSRTAAQTDIGYFWAANTGVLWNRTLQGIEAVATATLAENARLFALVNLAGADSAIACWDTKYTYVFWRPVTAIQNGENDNNPRTVGDPNWQPLINTPNFPEYTSGHVAYSSTVARILKLFFKTDQVTFTVTALNPLAVQKTRTYTYLSDAVDETIGNGFEIFAKMEDECASINQVTSRCGHSSSPNSARNSSGLLRCPSLWRESRKRLHSR